MSIPLGRPYTQVKCYNKAIHLPLYQWHYHLYYKPNNTAIKQQTYGYSDRKMRPSVIKKVTEILATLLLDSDKAKYLLVNSSTTFCQSYFPQCTAALAAQSQHSLTIWVLFPFSWKHSSHLPPSLSPGHLSQSTTGSHLYFLTSHAPHLVPLYYL